MGYWPTSATGGSFVEGDANPDGEQMLWGDAPADAIDDGLHRLIERMHTELKRYPTVEEVDAARPEAPEMLAAIEKAREVFNQDMTEDCEDDGVDRTMTEGELAAGLKFSNTKIALDCYMEDDKVPGCEVKWAGRADNGQFVYVLPDGEHWVPDSPYDDYPENARVWLRTGTLLNDPNEKVSRILATNGEEISIGKQWVSKVLPGQLDEPDVKVN